MIPQAGSSPGPINSVAQPKLKRILGRGKRIRNVDGHQLQDVGIVVDGGETDLVVVESNETKPECSTRRRIDGKLADKLALDREFDDFAGLGRR
jgi:hypothetical protein